MCRKLQFFLFFIKQFRIKKKIIFENIQDKVKQFVNAKIRRLASLIFTHVRKKSKFITDNLESRAFSVPAG